MIARAPRARAGITLTEILIAILIMGVGLISLATLFPLGLIRLREATRLARGGLTFESAGDDMDVRQLLQKSTFRNTWYWYHPAGNASARLYRDPFTQDGSGNTDPTGYISSTPGNALNLSAGLPICYDPLWRSLTGVVPNTGLNDPTLYYQASYAPTQADARFGSGIFGGSPPPYVRLERDGSLPSAYGLQRLTNFIPWNATNLTPQYTFTSHNFDPAFAGAQPSDVAGDLLTSIDDIVFNPTGGGANAPSSVLPDMSAGSPQADYRFTWFFTGRQSDAGANGSQFVGEIVVCDGRPFGFDPIPGGTALAPAGETVVEAVFGVAGNAGKGSNNSIVPVIPGATVGYAVNDRSVLLRWNAALPDPQVRPGGWICDVTYEPSVVNYKARVLNTATSFARCNWYQIAKRVDPQPDLVYTGYRSMVVTLTAPVKVRTVLNVSDGSPVHVNAALIMPSVISVYPRAFEVH